MIIQENASLYPYNTFGVYAYARAFGAITHYSQVIVNYAQLQKQYERIIFLGSGSNILFTENYLDACFLYNNYCTIKEIAEDENSVQLFVGSGVNWHTLVSYCVHKGYGGIENLALIPGTVGAAPMQNIGAYGCEIKDVINKVHVIDLATLTENKIKKEECEFGYRTSIFKTHAKDKYYIKGIEIKLHKNIFKINSEYGDISKILQEKNCIKPSIKDVFYAIIEIRQAKLPDPKLYGNAGSFFKNPIISIQQYNLLKQKYQDMPSYAISDTQTKIPAAWLIEQCGWKGKRIGDTGNHAKQALVIINYGSATGAEIFEHALNVQKSVQEKFDILLEPEVNIIS
jgi:UDP-N-acetylmuramate dehydrogenase